MVLQVFQGCRFCGGPWHKHANCPNEPAPLLQIQPQGHFAKVCLSKIKKISKTIASVCKDKEKYPYVNASNNPIGEEKINVILLINGVQTNGLIDTCSKFHHIDSEFCRRAKLNYEKNNEILKLELAVKNSAVKLKNYVLFPLNFKDKIIIL